MFLGGRKANTEKKKGQNERVARGLGTKSTMVTFLEWEQELDSWNEAYKVETHLGEACVAMYINLNATTTTHEKNGPHAGQTKARPAKTIISQQQVICCVIWVFNCIVMMTALL